MSENLIPSESQRTLNAMFTPTQLRQQLRAKLEHGHGCSWVCLENLSRVGCSNRTATYYDDVWRIRHVFFIPLLTIRANECTR